MTIRVTLSNSAGPLDSFTAPDQEAAGKELAGLLQTEWQISPGDIIKVEEIEG